MKKFLFVALLSLVTLGVKAYTVVFINNTPCKPIRMVWESESRLVNNSETINNLSSNNGETIDIIIDLSLCCGAGQGSGPVNGSFIFNTAQATGFVHSFQVSKCGVVTSYYVVTITYDSTTDTYTVEIV